MQQDDAHLPACAALRDSTAQVSHDYGSGYDGRELIEMSLSTDAVSSCTAGRNAKL